MDNQNGKIKSQN